MARGEQFECKHVLRSREHICNKVVVCIPLASSSQGSLDEQFERNAEKMESYKDKLPCFMFSQILARVSVQNESSQTQGQHFSEMTTTPKTSQNNQMIANAMKLT